MAIPPPTAAPTRRSPLHWTGRHLAAWDWDEVTAINRRLCHKGRAQHGANPDSHPRVAVEWTRRQLRALTLGEALEHLGRCQRQEPFFFFNESTFTEIARGLGQRVFASFTPLRRREATQALVRHVAGLLPHDALTEIVAAMWRPIRPAPGDRVRTLRGGLTGTAVGLGPDGRVHWRPDCASVHLITVPELLLRLPPASPLPSSKDSL